MIVKHTVKFRRDQSTRLKMGGRNVFLTDRRYLKDEWSDPDVIYTVYAQSKNILLIQLRKHLNKKIYGRDRNLKFNCDNT